MRTIITVIFTLLCCGSVVAQELEDDYRLYKIDAVEFQDRIIETDTTIFYRVAHARRDLYDEVTAYRFSHVDFARRGHYYTDRKATLNGLEVRHANLSVMRRLGLSERGYAGIAHGRYHMGGAVGMDEFTTMDGVPISGVNVSAFFSGKGYLGGMRATIDAMMRRGWSATFHVAARGGDDLYVKGVYNNSVDAGLRIAKTFESGAAFSLVALATVGDKGLRSGSTDEAFTLVGDNLYNPAWGYQAGKERTSRRRMDAVPFVAATYYVPIGNTTHMTLSLGGDYGHRKYSTLGWYDAMTPRPDNYRYMPSYYSSVDVAAAVAHEWRAANSDYTQLRWDDMYAQNGMSSSGAVYAMDDRVERIAQGQFVADFRTTLSEDVSLRYGLRMEYSSSRNYKQMVDLMGATHLNNIDYYLMDDDSFSHRLSNNLRDADLTVREGDRFSYDYDLRRRSVLAYVALEYTSSRWHVEADVQAGRAAMLRYGYFEKQLFPDAASYGRSNVMQFNPYTVRAAVGYYVSLRHHLRVGALWSEQLPEVRNMFLNPQYNNRVVDNPSLERIMATEFEYKYSSEKADVILTAYYNSVRNQRQTMRMYDDLSRSYSDVDISRLGMVSYGVELASEIRFSSSLRASFSAAAGRYVYAENPLVTIYADADNSVISNHSTSYMGGCYIGGAPQVSASAEITYLTYRGWAASVGAQLAALRYVDPSVVRRTERVAIQGSSSEEIFQRFISQRRLPDAVTMDASLSRWFNIGRSRLSLTLSVRNLLGSRDIVYGGYESSRIRNYRSGAQRIYLPQDDVLTYAYPRTYYAVVSWKF